MSSGWTGRRRSALALGVSALLLAADPSAQANPAQRLLSLVRSPNPGRDHKEFLSTVIEAGPAALPALDRLLVGELPPQNRSRVLAAICLIGGSQAVSILQRESGRGDKTLRPALAATLATADSPQNRTSLVRMLAEDDGGVTFQAAALALGLLRAPEGLKALQLFAPTPHSEEAEIVELAITWITGGEWAVDARNTGERDGVLAAVLRNGIPGLSPAIPVFDETTGKVWKHGASGWTSAPARPGGPGNPEALGLSAYSMTSSDGTRAAVSVEFRCGPACVGGAYDVVLRRASGLWRVQSMFPAWRG